MQEQQIITFIIHHWTLIAAAILVLGTIVWYETVGQSGGIPKLSPQQATLLLNREDAVVVDVRDNNAFKNGHVLGAINIPASTIASDEQLKKYQDKPLIITCAMGQQAPQLAQQLKKQGFSKLHILDGGISAWQGASLPLVKEK